MRVVVGMVKVAVRVDDVVHRCAAKAIESFLDLGPGRCNKSIHNEFAVRAVEYGHGSAGTVEHGDTVSKLLRSHGNGVELGAHTREQGGRRRGWLRVARHQGAERARGKEVC